MPGFEAVNIIPNIDRNFVLARGVLKKLSGYDFATLKGPISVFLKKI